MHPDIHLVTKLQALDTRISELQKEVAELPRHIAQIERALDAHTRRVEADRAALAANLKERKKLEGDVQAAEQKISKLRDQMLGAKTNEQYRAFQNEIGHFEKEIRKCEDRILDLMGESEPLDANVKKAEGALAQEKKQVEGEKKIATEKTDADKKELASATGERKAAAAQLRPPVLNQYERNRARWHGAAVAEVQDGRCSACHISLRPQFIEDVKHGDDLYRCESCGRFIYYNPPVEFEGEFQTEQPAS
jgi:predicted  nucleic acid-binding Zn-ribbon protein